MQANRVLTLTAIAALMAAPALAQTAPSTTRDGTPGNPPSTATGRAADAATGNRTSPDGTGNNPPGTALERAFDRAAGTNTSGAYPQNNDGTANNPPGTAAGRAVDRAQNSVQNNMNTTPGQNLGASNPGGERAGTITQGLQNQAAQNAPANPDGRNGSMAAGTAAGATAGATTMGSTAAAAPNSERASKIIGSTVYNDRNESVGSVDDLIVGQSGASTAVVSVGGFLGIGAKLVSVPFDQLRWNSADNRWVINGATKESLTALPAFSYDSNRRG